MCLVISNIRHGFIHPIPKVARENIIVYKVLENTDSAYYTPFQHLQVVFYKGSACLTANIQENRLYGIPLKWMVSKGIHAFRDVFHAYRRFQDRSSFRYPIFKAVIPKGTKYFIGDEKDIVSEKLIIFENNLAYEEWIEKPWKISRDY